MRALIVVTRPTEPDRGDPAPLALLVRALVDRGHEVHLVCSAAEPMRSFDALTVWPVHPDRSRGAPAFAARALEAGRACRPDIVLADRPHFALGAMVARRFGSRLVPIFSDAGPLGATPIRRVAAALDARIVRGAAVACLACGPLQADAALQLGAKRAIALPGVCGMEPADRPASGWLRRHLKIDGGVLALAWGGLGPDQGTDILIEGVKVAADADADVHAAIFGGDETSIDRYNAKAERLGIQHRVHLLGGWPASKLDRLLPEADILVEPSLDAERTPGALYSLLAAHRPVIVAEVPGRSRLVDPTVCELAPPDRLGIGHALAELAANPNLRQRLARAAASCIAGHHVYTAFCSTLSELERLVGGPRAGADAPEPTGTNERIRT